MFTLLGCLSVLRECIVLYFLFSDNLQEKKVEDTSQETSGDVKEQQVKDSVKSEIKEEISEQKSTEEAEKRVTCFCYFFLTVWCVVSVNHWKEPPKTPFHYASRNKKLQDSWSAMLDKTKKTIFL